MVFGNNRGGIMGIMSKFLGLDGSMMGKLMAMAAPIVMGVIGKHIKNKALDAVGLGNFLGSQKSSLGAAMPSALTSQLGFGNLLGNVAGAGKAAAGAFLEVLNEVRGHLTAEKKNTEQLAFECGADPESVYHAAVHLANNGEAQHAMGANAKEDTFSL